MKFLFTLLLLALGLVAAVPHATGYNGTDPIISSVDIVKRDPCDGIDAEPIINHEYRENECPAKKHGTYYHYIREAPFPRSECHYPLSCEITESHTTTTGWSTSFTAKMGKAFKAGISGGYSKSESEAHGRSWKFDPQPNECGYFSFVGIMKTTCGTYTEGSATYVNHAWTCNFPKTTINLCADQLWSRQGSTEPEGVVIFVRTDCLSRAPLGPEFQDPIYNEPDVALPRAVIVNLQATWVMNTCLASPQGSGGPEMKYVINIQGRGFGDDTLGPAGERLHDLLDECGDSSSGTNATEQYSFGWTPNNGTYDWQVNGTVKTQSKGCIGNAVVKAGGATMDQCV